MVIIFLFRKENVSLRLSKLKPHNRKKKEINFLPLVLMVFTKYDFDFLKRKALRMVVVGL